MSGIEEILREQKPPGFSGARPDPTSADVAIPRALRELEQTHDARRIAKDAGFSVKTLKETWKI